MVFYLNGTAESDLKGENMKIMPVIPNIKTSTTYRPGFGNDFEETAVNRKNTCQDFWDCQDCGDDLYDQRQEILIELRENLQEFNRLSNICSVLDTDDCQYVPVLVSIKECSEDIKRLKKELKVIHQKMFSDKKSVNN